MRIAVFSDSINIPPKEGINVHAYDLLLELSKQKTIEPILIVCDRGWLSHEILAEQPFDTILLPEADFYNVAYIAELLERYQIDIAQSYMTYFGAVVLGQAAYQAHVPCVAELHDLEESVVNVYFTETELEQATHDHSNFQKQAAAMASVVRVMSKHDYDIIAATWPDFTARRYIWMPVARPLGEVERISHPQLVLYIGNMSYAPNAEGAEIIRRKIAPLLDRHVTFIGRGSESFTSDMIDSKGMVDDIDEYLANTAVGLSPILQGSGMKIKNLTYLSYGIPLVTTTLGAQGFPASEAIIIEDDFARWPDIINDLLQNHEQWERRSRIAKAYFMEHFEIAQLTNRLLTLYQEAIDNYEQTRTMLHVPEDARPINLEHVYWLRELREAGSASVRKETRIRKKRS